MKKFSFVIFFPLLLASYYCFAQAEVYMGDISGPPLKEKQYTDIVGSPYFIDQWEKGMVSLVNGKQYSGLLLKYDEFADELNFKYGSGEPMKFVEDVDFFIINHFDTGTLSHIQYKFVSIYLNNRKEFLQSYSWSEKDELKFLIKRKKSMYTTQLYNSATKTNTFENSYSFFVQKKNVLTKIKLNEKELFSFLTSKSQEVGLRDYVKKNALKISKPDDFAKAILYINSLN